VSRLEAADQVVPLILRVLLGGAVAWAIATGKAGYWTPPVVLLLLVPRNNAKVWVEAVSAWMERRNAGNTSVGGDTADRAA
jgi:hypothetical protein